MMFLFNLRSWGLPLFLALCLLSAVPAAAKPPNVVFILADDLDNEVFSQLGAIKSLLADNGVRFKNNFVSLSLCCPSRVTTLRGQFAHNTGVYTNQLPNGGFEKAYRDGLENSTIATWLQAAGYRTALFGKYLNGYPDGAPSPTYVPPGWTHWVSPNGGSPYSEYNYALNENGKTVYYGGAPSHYLDDVLARKTTAFIKNTTANYPDKPFFIYLAPYAPHEPATPPPRYAGRFPKAKAPRTASLNEAIVTDKPAWIRKKAPLTATEIANIDDLYRKRRQSMLAVEDLVKELIDTLRATGQLDQTFIFFTSDNGFHLGQHRLSWGKNTAYEEDIGVPLVVRGPGVPAGRVVDKITANVDFAPTFAEIAGVTPPSFVDGRSLVPLLTGTTPPVWRQALLLEHGGPVGVTASGAEPLLKPRDAYRAQPLKPGAARVFAGLRTPERSYVEYLTGERELYELQTDPAQLNNVYATADPALKTKLSTWLGSLRHAAGQALRNIEQTPP